jgi:tetratricopeptide (TPR) repeat protein
MPNLTEETYEKGSKKRRVKKLKNRAMNRPDERAAKKNENESKRNMKTTLAITLTVCGGMFVAFLLGRQANRRETRPERPPAVAAVEAPAVDPYPEPGSNDHSAGGSAARPASPSLPPNAALARETLPTRPALLPLVHQAIQTLTSAQATYAHKQVAWQQLRESGKLDQAISELEQTMTAQPNFAEYPATLGQAYLHKAGSIQDVREQGILGMKADQSFDAALALDPTSWEARFWKATAMSYWPSQLGKGAEVIEHCLELVRVQENRPSQPQFVQSYLLLGDQYQRMGHVDYARQAWQRGLTYFPENSDLQSRLKGGEQPQQTAAR